MKCPVCWAEGLANIRFRDSTEAKNRMNYKKYTCMVCDTNYTVMYAIKEVNEKVRALVLAYRHIQAIKLHRSITGWGLKESKMYCDNIRQELADKGLMQLPPTYRELAGRRLVGRRP